MCTVVATVHIHVDICMLWQVLKVLSEAGVDTTSFNADLDYPFSDNGEFVHLFCGLESEYQQKKYFKTHFNFVVRIYIMYVKAGLPVLLCSTFRNLFGCVLENAEFGKAKGLNENVYLKRIILYIFLFWRQFSAYWEKILLFLKLVILNITYVCTKFMRE